jgi:hypothetical protein
VSWPTAAAPTGAELIATAQVGSIRARRDPELLRSFLAGTGLTI